MLSKYRDWWINIKIYVKLKKANLNPLEKRKFDMFHYATAKINDLKFLSYDTDITKIDKLYNTMLKQGS